MFFKILFLSNGRAEQNILHPLPPPNTIKDYFTLEYFGFYDLPDFDIFYLSLICESFIVEMYQMKLFCAFPKCDDFTASMIIILDGNSYIGADV